MRDLFAALHESSRWNAVVMQFPHGTHWQHDTCELVRSVVLKIADTLLQSDAPIRVACQYADESKSRIEGMIVHDHEATVVIPLKLTPGLVRIGERHSPVYVAHAPGPRLLVRELIDAIGSAHERAFRVGDGYRR